MGAYDCISDAIWLGGIKIFMVVWVVFGTIAITSRLEKIIQLLKEKK